VHPFQTKLVQAAAMIIEITFFSGTPVLVYFARPGLTICELPFHVMYD
jgi:hypothetical protein